MPMLATSLAVVSKRLDAVAGSAASRFMVGGMTAPARTRGAADPKAA